MKSGGEQSESSIPRRSKNVQKSFGTFDKGLPQPALPLEIWDLILVHLYPSELVRIAAVSPAMKAIVICHPIWKVIYETAKLPTAKKNGRHYNLVIKYSKRLCEVCYARCAKDGHDAALPVFLDDVQVKPINMCLACRRKHFKELCERGFCDIYPCRKCTFGGQIGVEANEAKELLLRIKRSNKELEIRRERRKELSDTLAILGTQIDEEVEACMRYINEGDILICQVLNGIRAHHRRQNGMNKRGEALYQGLKECHLIGEYHSPLAFKYIRDGGDMAKCIRVIREKKWLSDNTTYDSDCLCTSMGEYGFYQKEDHRWGKERALAKYVGERLDRGQWEDIGREPETPDRPPESLWNVIRKVSVLEWKRYMRRALAAGLEASPSYRTQILKMDHKNPEHLSDNLCLNALEQGVIAIAEKHTTMLAVKPQQSKDQEKDTNERYKRKSAKEPNNTPTLSEHLGDSFVAVARSKLGENEFAEELHAAKQPALTEVKMTYIREKFNALPSGIQDFVDTCNSHEPQLTSSMYYYRRKRFIRDELPAIVESEGVHISLMIPLLRDLYQEGRIKICGHQLP